MKHVQRKQFKKFCQKLYEEYPEVDPHKLTLWCSLSPIFYGWNIRVDDIEEIGDKLKTRTQNYKDNTELVSVILNINEVNLRLLQEKVIDKSKIIKNCKRIKGFRRK